MGNSPFIFGGLRHHGLTRQYDCDDCANRATHIESTRSTEGSRRSGAARPLHESTTSRGNECRQPDIGRSDEIKHRRFSGSPNPNSLLNNNLMPCSAVVMQGGAMFAAILKPWGKGGSVHALTFPRVPELLTLDRESGIFHQEQHRYITSPSQTPGLEHTNRESRPIDRLKTR
jgi:hypothetical protein